jgi:rRNA processing protein Gar1
MSDALFDHSRDDVIKASDLARMPHTVLTQNNTLIEAVGAFGPASDPYLAVVTDKDSMALVGVLLERDFMQAQQRALMKARAEERGEA